LKEKRLKINWEREENANCFQKREKQRGKSAGKGDLSWRGEEKGY